MFIVALTICHLGHAAEPICVQENVKEAIPCLSAEAGIRMRSHPKPEGRGYYNIDARRSGHENLWRASHRLRVNRVLVVAKPKRKVRLEFNSRRAVRPDLPLRGSSHESAGREGQTYFH